jgi:hypothetical protein
MVLRIGRLERPDRRFALAFLTSRWTIECGAMKTILPDDAFEHRPLEVS